jgi:TnpA family transposase
MPRHSILSVTERDNLLALPDTEDGLIRYHTFSDSDQSLIGQRRGNPNRLGVAIQLCLLRYPGTSPRLLREVRRKLPEKLLSIRSV